MISLISSLKQMNGKNKEYNVLKMMVIRLFNIEVQGKVSKCRCDGGIKYQNRSNFVYFN
jgi:hypothetical protein